MIGSDAKRISLTDSPEIASTEAHLQKTQAQKCLAHFPFALKCILGDPRGSFCYGQCGQPPRVRFMMHNAHLCIVRFTIWAPKVSCAPWWAQGRTVNSTVEWKMICTTTS